MEYKCEQYFLVFLIVYKSINVFDSTHNGSRHLSLEFDILPNISSLGWYSLLRFSLKLVSVYFLFSFSKKNVNFFSLSSFHCILVSFGWCIRKCCCVCFLYRFIQRPDLNRIEHQQWAIHFGRMVHKCDSIEILVWWLWKSMWMLLLEPHVVDAVVDSFISN